jgi:hypothetical protein
MITRKIGNEYKSFKRPVVMEEFYSDDHAHAAVDLFNEVTTKGVHVAS